MKVVVIALAALCAFVAAEPRFNDRIQLTDSRLITDAISSVIQDLSQNIKDAGLDPLHIKEENFSYALPVPAIFSAQASIINVRSTGLSNIVIEDMNFGVLTQRLRMTLSLPRIEASIEKASARVVFFSNVLTAEASGSVAINQIRVAVDVRASVGIISGISIRSLDIDFTLGGIDSNLNVVVQDNDISSTVNTLLGTTIPNTLSENRAELNELLEIILLDILNDLL